MAVTLCQVMGFVLSVLGLVGILAATCMDQWGTEDRFNSPVTSVYSYSGLWRSCVKQSSGFTECRPYFTILGLPALLQAVRALMIVGIILGAIGCFIAIFALKCLKMGNMEDNIKATMTLVAGIMFVLGGICGIAGVSAFANLVVTSFRFTTFTDEGGFGGGMGLLGGGGGLTPRYTFGPALFVGWIGGAVLFIGGVLMCFACRGMVPDKQQYDGMAYKAASQHNTIYKVDTRPRQAYGESYRVPSMEGRQSNQRFDYV